MRTTFRVCALAVITLLAACFAAEVMADTLYLRDGEQKDGRLREITRDTIVFEGRQATARVPKHEALRLQLQRARKYDDVTSVDQITDPDLRRWVAEQPTVEDYPAAGHVVLLERTTADLTEPGVAVVTRRTIAKVLRQRGEEAGTGNIFYYVDVDSPTIDFALTVTPDGRVMHLDDTALKDESIHAQNPAYARLWRLRFACKEPRPGSILDVQHTVRRERPGVLEPFFIRELFRGDEPIITKEVVVLVPEGEEDSLSTALMGPGVVDHARETGDGVTRMVWSLREPQPGIIEEPHMPPTVSFAPNLTVVERASWPTVFDAYTRALAALPPLPEDLGSLARTLAAEGGAEAIHNHVARNVRTLPVPQWHYSIVPHPPGETAARGVANSLDKNYLYHKMLEAAGIESAFVLARTRGAGPMPAGLVSLRFYDASVVYLKDDARFTSAESDRVLFDVLPGQLQNTPVAILSDNRVIQTVTPLAELDEETFLTEFDASLDAAGTLALTVTYTGRGNTGGWLRGMKDFDDDRLRIQLQGLASYLHPASVLTGHETSDLADLTRTPWIRLECAIPGYAVRAGDDLMLFDLPALMYSAGDVGRPTREHDIFFGAVSRDATRGVVRLPEGYSVYATPEVFECESPVVSYRAELHVAGNELRFTDRYDQRMDTAPAALYPEFKQCRERRASLPRERVILMREE